jgi:signal peptidase I
VATPLARKTRNGTLARTIEQIVRAQLLLLALILIAISTLLLTRRGPFELLGVALVSVPLLVSGQLLARLPGRDLLQLAQRASLALVLGFFVLVGLVPKLGWYRPLTVLSGSMRPTFSPGDLIIVRPEPLRAVRVGQVISYNVPIGAHQLETHRIIRILRPGPDPVLQTQGDANTWHDPWTAVLHGGPAWHLSLVIPYTGYLINTLRSRTLHLAAVVGAPALLTLIALAELWGLPGLASRTCNRLRRPAQPPRHRQRHAET